jgi:hypothetical protein
MTNNSRARGVSSSVFRITEFTEFTELPRLDLPLYAVARASGHWLVWAPDADPLRPAVRVVAVLDLGHQTEGRKSMKRSHPRRDEGTVPLGWQLIREIDKNLLIATDAVSRLSPLIHPARPGIAAAAAMEPTGGN